MADKCDECGEVSSVLIGCDDGIMRCVECCWVDGYDDRTGESLEDTYDDDECEQTGPSNAPFAYYDNEQDNEEE